MLDDSDDGNDARRVRQGRGQGDDRSTTKVKVNEYMSWCVRVQQNSGGSRAVVSV